MKIILIILASIFSLNFNGINSNMENSSVSENSVNIEKREKIKWLSIEEALEMNEKNPKKIIIDFYTDWCGYCKKLDRVTFGHPKIIEYINENYYAVKFDGESNKTITYKGDKYRPTKSRRAGVFNGTHEFTSKMINNRGRIGYPSILFLDENNDKITFVPSYLEPTDMDVVLHFFAGDFHLKTDYQIFADSYKSSIR